MKLSKHVGRPVGPSEDRSARPWDPESLRDKDKLALKTIAANPDAYRWQIANKLGISLSKLSIISCSALGQEYLKYLSSTPHEQLQAFRLEK